MDTVDLCQCLKPDVTATTLRPWRRITLALLVMTGRVTRLGLSRWAGTGGSDRTVQRFCSTVLPWAMRCWVFFRPHGYGPAEVYLLAGDAVVVTTAGKTPEGLDRVCSSVHGQPGPGLACFTWSRGSVQARRALPRRVEPVVRSAAETAASPAKAAAKQPQAPRATRRPGRPPGRTNTHPAHVTLTPELWRINARRHAWRQLLARVVPRTSLVLDGHVGHHHARHLARQANLPRMSTRRCAAALDTPDTGPDAGRGPPRQDGHQVDDDDRPGPYRKEPTVAGPIQTRLSQAHLLHQACARPLHVVISATTNRHTHACAPVVLGSRDLELADAPLVDDSGWRCPIELNFRDANQDWGLEDCLHVTPTGVTHAVHVSWFMGNVASRRRTDIHPRDPDDRVRDLNADGRGDTYVAETINMLPEQPAPVL